MKKVPTKTPIWFWVFAIPFTLLGILGVL